MKMQIFKRLKNKSILVVEDDAVIRKNIASMLKFFFKNVYEAVDGYDGLDKYEEHLPDIVMTDLKMPNMCGFELLGELKKRSSKSYTIIVSAHTDKELLIQAIHDGIDRYLIKPLVEEDLFASFEAYLKKLDEEHLEFIELENGTQLDLENSIAIVAKEQVHLNNKEKLLLKLLCSNTSHTFSFEEIEYQVWGSKSMSLSALRSVVRDLRKKIGEDYVVSISGVGYKLYN
jgi:DNA-binding response OmpR family regulator